MTHLTLCEVAHTGLDHLESFSPFCLKVHRALRYAGLAYDSEHGKHPGSFKHHNPAGQVPVLLVGDEPVCDSTRIVERIERLAGAPLHGGLAPDVVASARLWEAMADTALNGFVVAARWADDANWPRAKAAFFHEAPRLICALISPRLRSNVIRGLVARDVWRAGPEACWRRFEATLDDLEGRAPGDGRYWVADRITVADLAIFAQLQSLRAEITPRQAELVAARPRLSRYLDRVDDATRERRPLRGPVSSPRVQEMVALLSA